MRFLFICLPLVMWGQDKPKLFVYVPSTIRPAIFEKQLQKDCPDLRVTLYNHHRPLIKAVSRSVPAAIISLETVVSQQRFSMFDRALEGIRDGKDWEQYLLLSKRSGVLQLPVIRVGVVAILNRKQMLATLTAMFDDRGALDYVPVTKVPDLLALLQVDQADGIMVRQEYAQTYFQNHTEMDLVSYVLPKAKLGLPVMIISKEISPKTRKLIIDSIQGLDQEMNLKLRVDSWTEYAVSPK